MNQTVRYSATKLMIMAAVCGLGLPLLSPVMLLTGPGAIVLVPLLLIGGPIYAIPCLIRAAGDGVAVQVRPQGVMIRTLWRTLDVPAAEVTRVQVEQETLWYMIFLPLSTKANLVFSVGRAGAAKTVRLPLNLLDLDVPGALAFAKRFSEGAPRAAR